MGSNVKIANKYVREAIAEMSETVLIGEDKGILPEELLIDFRMKNIFHPKSQSEALLVDDNKYFNCNPFDNIVDNTNVGMNITILDVWHWGELYLDNLIIKRMLSGH